ncbi:hypothetical protein AWX17_05700 [Priestia megaterium]|nr:hypothetical protein AWX17_05700 [Priestia megaterium]
MASSLYFVFIILSFIISFFVERILIIKSHRSVGEVQATSLFYSFRFVLFGTNFRYWWWGHSMSILNIFEFLATTFISVLIFIISDIYGIKYEVDYSLWLTFLEGADK